MQKNDSICAITEGLGSNGEGVIKHEGVTFFVPACLPGERVRFKILKLKGNVGYGKVEEILTPAEERVRPKCAAFLRCGGCRLQHLDYTEQLRLKGNMVKDCLRKIGGIEQDVPSAIKSDFEYGYRNKLQLPIGVDKNGEDVIGFYAERSHRIIPIDSCAIHPDWATELIHVLKAYMREICVHGYDEISMLQIRWISSTEETATTSTTQRATAQNCSEALVHMKDGSSRTKLKAVGQQKQDSLFPTEKRLCTARASLYIRSE